MEKQRKGDGSFFSYEFLSFDLSNAKLQLLRYTKNCHINEATFLVHVAPVQLSSVPPQNTSQRIQPCVCKQHNDKANLEECTNELCSVQLGAC